MKFRFWLAACLLTLSLVCPLLSSSADAATPDDRFALKGLKQAKAVFDVRLAELDKLLFNLGLVLETHEGLSSQKVRPVLVITLRGPAVKLFTREQAPKELLDLLHELQAKGVRIEICSVATRVFTVDNSRLVPDVILVGNVLTTQIALQNKGYALITLN